MISVFLAVFLFSLPTYAQVATGPASPDVRV
jgi:hypothetical protein